MTKPRLTILGVQLESEAYPNVLHRVRALEGSQEFNTHKIHHSGWSQETQSASGRSRLLRNFWRMLYAHLAVLARHLRAPSADCIYVPYPASLLLWFLSFFPGGKAGTRLVADAFISLYDTIVLDRQLLRAGGLPAKLLFAVETRAFRFADTMIVDTPMTAAHLASLFKLPFEKFVPVSLATDEYLFTPSAYEVGGEDCRVLFIGTLIPLHGVPTIVEAAAALQGRRDIRLKIIGDGQENAALEQYAATANSNIEWQREWLSSARIAEEIAMADICLGIFGDTEKTQRVLPFKLYAYSRIGRCIITAGTSCSDSYVDALDYRPWCSVEVANAPALAAAIIELADNVQLRSQLASNAARFYEERLSNAAAEKLVTETLLPRTGPSSRLSACENT